MTPTAPSFSNLTGMAPLPTAFPVTGIIIEVLTETYPRSYTQEGCAPYGDDDHRRREDEGRVRQDVRGSQPGDRRGRRRSTGRRSRGRRQGGQRGRESLHDLVEARSGEARRDPSQGSASHAGQGRADRSHPHQGTGQDAARVEARGAALR